MNKPKLLNATIITLTLNLIYCQVETFEEKEAKDRQSPNHSLETVTGSTSPTKPSGSHRYLASASTYPSIECTGFMAFPGSKRWVPALPDKASRYDSYAFKPDSGNYEGIIMTGQFPYARYFSINLYDFDAGENIGALPDFQIEPNAGHTNPYRPGADRTALERSFTVYLVRPDSALEIPTGANVIELPAGVETISIIARVYRPDQGLDDLGGVDRPQLHVVHSNQAPQCPDGGMDLDSLIGISNLIFFPAAIIDARDTIADIQGRELVFVRADGTGLFPNGDNEYVFSPLKSSGVAMFRFKPPTFEDTFSGSPLFNGQSQTRYWSVCVGGLAATQTSSCLEDDRATMDDDGYVTVVIGPAHLRGITERAGLNFLNRGLVYKPIIIHRHLLDAPAFDGRIALAPQAPQELPGDFNRSDLDELDVRHYMGDYAPYGQTMSSLAYRLWLRWGR